MGRPRLGAGCRLSEAQKLDQVLTCSGSTPRLLGRETGSLTQYCKFPGLRTLWTAFLPAALREGNGYNLGTDKGGGALA